MSRVSAQKYRHYSSTFAAQAASCSRHVDQPPQSFCRRWRCESAGRRGSWCRQTAADVDRRLTTRGCRRRLDRTVPGRWDTWRQSACNAVCCLYVRVFATSSGRTVMSRKSVCHVTFIVETSVTRPRHNLIRATSFSQRHFTENRHCRARCKWHVHTKQQLA